MRRVGGCNGTALRGFAPIRALYDLEFKEPAFEGTIKERGSARGSQADQLRQAQVGSEKIRPPAGKSLFEDIAETRVELRQFRFIPGTDPIWGVRHQDAFSARWPAVQNVGLFQLYNVGKPACPQVGLRRPKRHPMTVATRNHKRSIRRLRRPAVLAEAAPGLPIEVVQLLKSKPPSQTRRDFSGDLCGFHEDRPTPAHRVQERLIRGPS